MQHTQNYIEAVQKEFNTRVAREHSYRPALKNYLEKLLPDVQAMNEPARQKCGAPDFVISKMRKGTLIDIGYIEAKDIGVRLDTTENKAQLKRYLDSLDNLIHTDNLEFRFYKERELVATIRIADVESGKIIPKPDSFKELESLLINFAEYIGQTIKSPRVLAQMMARKARLMKSIFYEAVKDHELNTGLHEQLAAFRKILIHDLDEEQFADIYAQTITYGLFTARLHDTSHEDFSRQEARDLIPRSNPFLRHLFDYVCGADMDDRVVWIVDALCEVYRATDVGNILSNFNRGTGRTDPIVHFYETFLSEYDPSLKQIRGVWYTPEAVVNFIVRAIDEVLKTHFNISDGIVHTGKVTIEIDSQEADKRRKTGKKVEQKKVHRVQMLDVATGTGSFMAEVIRQIYDQFSGQQGMWSGYVEDHLLPRLHGFELLMASYAMCHLKLDLLLNKTGYKPSNPKAPPRVSAYLANSLEEYHPDTGTLLATWLAKEANAASHIKRDTPVMVAFGNPPYRGQSSNKGDWIMSLMEVYKKEPGGKEKLKEKNPKWINNDYVKFMRFGEYFIEQNQEGILAYITSNSYLDNPTFRGVRWHLLKTFDEIYILDLHGNSNIPSLYGAAVKDENVFDIKESVAIIIAIKNTGKDKNSVLGKLYYSEYLGSREKKYEFLFESSLLNISWREVQAIEPYYFFNPKDFTGNDEYRRGFSLADLFIKKSTGYYTSCDDIVIGESEEQVSTQVQEVFGKGIEFDHRLIRKTSYRPMDERFIYYDPDLLTRSRKKFVNSIDPQNNYILLMGKSSKSKTANHFLVANNIAELKCAEYSKGSYMFPLYITHQINKQRHLGLEPIRKMNLDPELVDRIASSLSLKFIPDHTHEKNIALKCFTPLDLLDYIYAVLHSPIYRKTWEEFLKIDFPIIPYPASSEKFLKLASLGREIRHLHIMDHDLLNKPITEFNISGSNKIDRHHFQIDSSNNGIGRVFLNKEQYFTGIPTIAWEFTIGGYQPAQRWLKDRKGKILSFDDIRHYGKIIVALTETHRLMHEIDSL